MRILNKSQMALMDAPYPPEPGYESMLYNGTVLLNPTRNEADDGKEPEVIATADRISAPNEKIALLILGTKIPADKLQHWSRMEVFLSPR